MTCLRWHLHPRHHHHHHHDHLTSSRLLLGATFSSSGTCAFEAAKLPLRIDYVKCVWRLLLLCVVFMKLWQCLRLCSCLCVMAAANVSLCPPLPSPCALYDMQLQLSTHSVSTNTSKRTRQHTHNTGHRLSVTGSRLHTQSTHSCRSHMQNRGSMANATYGCTAPYSQHRLQQRQAATSDPDCGASAPPPPLMWGTRGWQPKPRIMNNGHQPQNPCDLRSSCS